MPGTAPSISHGLAHGIGQGSVCKRIPLTSSNERIRKQGMLTEGKGRRPASIHCEELLPAQVLKSGWNLSWIGRGLPGGSCGREGTESLIETRAKAGRERRGRSTPAFLSPCLLSALPISYAQPEGSQKPGIQGGAQNRQRRAENRSGWNGA